MDLYAYLSKHDKKPRPDGPELIRLAKAAGISSYYLYMTALGHKRVGEMTAYRLSENSIGRELETDLVNREKGNG